MSTDGWTAQKNNASAANLTWRRHKNGLSTWHACTPG